MIKFDVQIPSNIASQIARKFRNKLNRIDPVDVATVGARPIVNLAKKYAPFRTGTLEGSIDVYDDIHPSVRGDTAWSGSVRVGTGKGVDYAYWQEFGTSRFKGKFYLTRAYAEKQAEAKRKMTEYIRGML